MSGSAHNRKVAETAAKKALQNMGYISVSPESGDTENKNKIGKNGRLSRGSIEAGFFFIVGTGYAIMSAFGYSVNFVAGVIMCLFVAGVGTDLLFRSTYTYNWTTLSKAFGTLFIWVLCLVAVNQGYEKVKQTKNPNAETLSAIQNLGDLIRSIPSTQPVRNNTNVFEVDGKYPNISLSEPRDMTAPGGSPLINVDYVNTGSGTAYAQRTTSGVFTAKESAASEDAIFRLLYSHEGDRDPNIQVETVDVRGSGIMPIGGELLTVDGKPAKDSDRTDFLEKKNVLYVALLASYQDTKGRPYHTELCYFHYAEVGSLSRKCKAHNGHG